METYRRSSISLKKGLTSFFIFVFIGILLGFYIKLEEYTASYLMNLLNDEVQDGTKDIVGGCNLEYKKASLNFITLNGSADDVSVVCDKKQALYFKQLKLDASWRSMLSKVVEFDDLKLIKGKAFGVSPKSATYKFIDYVSRDAPPGSTPPLIKILLHNLTLVESEFDEPLGNNLLKATGVSLSLSYDEKRDVILQPKIEKLEYIIRKNNSSLPLGKADGQIKITDDQTQFQSVNIGNDNATISLTGQEDIGKPKSLSGKALLDLSLTYIGLPNWLSGRFLGESKVSGEIGSPYFDSAIDTKNENPLKLAPGEFTVLSLDGVKGKFTVDVNDGDPLVTVSELNGEFNDQTISIVEPLRIIDSNLTGTLKVTTKSLTVGPAKLNNISSLVKLSGPLDKVTANLEGAIETVEAFNAILKNINFTAFNQDNFFLVKANQSDVPEGELLLDAKIDLSKDAPFIENAKYDFKNYPFSFLFNSNNSSLFNIARLNGTGKVSGFFDATKINVDSDFKINSNLLDPNLKTDGKLKIANGALDFSATKDKYEFTKLNLSLTPENTKGILKALFDTSSLSMLPSNCFNSNSQLNLNFQRGNFDKANGSLKIDNLNFGCGDTKITLKTSRNIPINSGAFDFKNIELVNNQNDINLTGTFVPFGNSDIKLLGSIPIHTLGGFVPGVDELSGDITANLSVKGPLNLPIINGNAELKNGNFGLESADVSGTRINGLINFDGSVLKLNKFGGELNGGAFQVEGQYNLSNPIDSSFTYSSQGMVFNPAKGLSVAADAILKLTKLDQKPSIEGLVLITNADFEKKLDVTTLAKGAIDLLFASRNSIKFSNSKNSAPLDIPLSIQVTASRNINAVTNFFGAEAKGAINISGTTSKPLVTGSIDALNGWFGLREHRFNLINGSIKLYGTDSVPVMSILGESSVRTSFGDIVTVYLDANGPIDSPSVQLSSDTGLTQTEILSLLTASGQIIQQTQINQLGTSMASSSLSLVDSVPLLNYSKFLRYLGQIDSIAIEPQFNIQTGLIEPTVTATKKINDNLYLLGQGFIGSQITETRIGGVYSLLPFLNLQAFFTSASDQQNVALEVNSVATILAQRKKFVSLEVSGNELFNSQEILNSANLNITTRIHPEDLATVRQSLKKLYRKAGYFDTIIQTECRAPVEFCSKIKIKITEESKSIISNVIIEDPEAGKLRIPSDIIPYDAVDSLANASILIDARANILKWLRVNGFLAARIEAQYQKDINDSLKRILSFKIFRGKPINFEITGNKFFSSESLLSTINITNRKVSFGSNTGKILAQNIIQLYQDSGFLDVNVTENRVSQSDFDIIKINISEGHKFRPAGFKFKGNILSSKEDILKIIKESSPILYSQITTPKTFFLESLELQTTEIRKALVKQGFDQASVEVIFDKDYENSDAHIVYNIVENDRSPAIQVSEVSFTEKSFDNSLEIPEAPNKEIYNFQLKDYTEQIKRALSEQGYRNSTISIDSKNLNRISLFIDPGVLTQTGSIKIDGLEDVSESTIRNLLDIRPGEPLSQQKIRSIKSKLLSQGLFSKIDIVESDSADPSIKNIEIKVQEKPLTTLDLGGGYNTEFGAHIFAEGTDRSLFQDGRSLNLRLDAYVNSPSGDSFSRGVAAIKYTSPAFLDSKFVLSEDLRYQKFNAAIYEFDLDRTSLTSSLYRNLGKGVSTSVGHTILSENLSNVSKDVVIGEFDSGTNILSYLGTTLTIDKRDNPLNPISGFNIIWDSKFADHTLGSEAEYIGTSLRASNLIPFDIGNYKFAFAQSLKGGVLDTLGNDKYIPISQRY